MKSLTIGRLAKQAGVNLETVRFYERRGLLPKPPRTASGYRLFPADAARRLRFIRRAQELGFSLQRSEGCCRFAFHDVQPARIFGRGRKPRLPTLKRRSEVLSP
jgi:hypothetical protein